MEIIEMRSTIATRILGALFGYTVLAVTVGAGLFTYGLVVDSHVYARWGAGVFFSPIGVMAYALVLDHFLEFLLPEGLQAFANWRSSKAEAFGMLAFNAWAVCGLVAMPVTVGAWLAGWGTIEVAGWYVMFATGAIGFTALIIGTIALVVWTTADLAILRKNR
jgi:hypothetical protein